MTRVRFLGPDTDAYVASVERHAPEFEERTGIELDVGCELEGEIRVRNRRMRKPVTGMTTDIVSRKPAVSHCPTAAET